MNAADIYALNLRESSEFASLDALYHVFAFRQEESWEKWWELAKSLPAKETLAIEKQMLAFITKKIAADQYRPAVNNLGIIIGNKISFLHLYYSGAEDFIDFTA